MSTHCCCREKLTFRPGGGGCPVLYFTELKTRPSAWENFLCSQFNENDCRKGIVVHIQALGQAVIGHQPLPRPTVTFGVLNDWTLNDLTFNDWTSKDWSLKYPTLNSWILKVPTSKATQRRKTYVECYLKSKNWTSNLNVKWAKE
jgi:hypothetical protein